ncbi:WD40 repeat-like protein [Apodospora peruviana]|uniref:WD40 repeat-like protein n=1 Tax=Apodospora peruviana TaxID=516989 RepID=A0AAE0HXW4_9PEZI|nr:WD40 repeat-like protein [Apodospora peruviana]
MSSSLDFDDLLSPRRLRRMRQAKSSPPCFSDSPTDSGYGSAPASPETPTPSEKQAKRPAIDLWVFGDGNGSDIDDDPADSNDGSPSKRLRLDTPTPIARERPSLKKRQTATLPARSTRPRPSLTTAFTSESGTTLPRRRSNIGLVRAGTRSLRLRDRFIPTRTHSTDTTEKYRTGKAANELTLSEKILRHNGATEDPFCYRRRVVTPMASDFRAQFRSETASSQNRVGSVLGPLAQNVVDSFDRQASIGTIWAVGGVAPAAAVNNGRGQLVRSGTNARLFRTSFPAAKPQTEEHMEKHEARIATALGLDRTQRVLDVNVPSHQGPILRRKSREILTQWNGTEWVQDGSPFRLKKPTENRTLPIAPFKVLDAPNLRDDFYCSVLAYNATTSTLAVALGDLLYGWSEDGGVKLLNAGTQDNCHLTSVSFSSTQGSKCILAYGRSNKTLGLMSLYDDPEPSVTGSRTSPLPRFEVIQPAPVICLSWKPTCTKRPSKCPIYLGSMVRTEDLLVGDESGAVYYYAVEWPARYEVERHNWPGQVTLLARITIHTQQICGLSWSPNGELFATGGNDNLCCLFETAKVLEDPHAQNHDEEQVELSTTPQPQGTGYLGSGGYLGNGTISIASIQPPIPPPSRSTSRVRHLKSGDEKYRWRHGAAVKAIAFCPWQDGLVATGGGSNDKCIHFFHTTSGAALATISVSAQVTSLIWSTTRREIAATFGYAQPEHTVRIAVFSWPDCRQVAAIPWAGEHRALYAIPYPGLKDDRAARAVTRQNPSRTLMEGCIMVASSDKSVKFHEVWSADKKATAGGVGMLGGSDILESLEGIDKEGDVIR